jgi:nitroreductase
MELYEALYTTRAMRRVRPDPIPLDAQARILDAAVRAPSGGNQQNWRFLVVDDPAVKARLGPLYRDAMALLWRDYYAPQLQAARERPDDPESIQFLRIQRSAQHLADHFEEVPLYLFAFAQNDPGGSSIYPAVWSAMLAARAEGIGSCLTQVLVFRNQEAMDVLEVPRDEHWIMSACVSLGYPTGRWGVAARRPVHEVTNRNRWGGELGIDIPVPLWSPGEGTVPRED